MKCDKRNDHEIYRLILSRRRATEILLAAEGSGWALPELALQTGKRIAEQLTRGTKEGWGVEAYCLFLPALAAGAQGAPTKRYALMESAKQNGDAPSGTCWMATAAAMRDSVLPGEDIAAIRVALEETRRSITHPATGPFARPGWLRELFEWVGEQLDPLGLRLTGSFQQFNASATFSLIRIETTGPAVWFKATGHPNSHELTVTATLARLFPGSLPTLLAVHPAWNGWLSREAAGVTLDGLCEISAWVRAAKALAELQIASLGKTEELLDSGCKDLRASQLVPLIDPFLNRMGELMARQTKPDPAPLGHPELQLLSQELKQACSALQSLGLPDTVGHIDFNPGNVVVSPQDCVFLDWAEGCVANPLVTFEYLREHSRRQSVGGDGGLGKIAAAYLRPWQAFFSLADLERALAVSPLVAVLAYAVGNRAWCSSTPLENPTLASYLRSLTRRMYREAARIREQTELCLI